MTCQHVRKPDAWRRGRACRRARRTLRFESLERRELLSGADPSFAAAEDGLRHLRDVMDNYHKTVIVYEDVSTGGNHFHARGKIGDHLEAVSMNGSWADNPHSGATCIRFEFLNVTGANYGGFYLQNGVLDAGQSVPELNWGTVPGAGMDLSGAVTLRFWARGERGGERIEFFHGGIGRDAVTGAPIAPYPDSSPRYPSIGTTFTLTTNWQLIEIDVSQLNLSHSLGLGWVANAPNNPQHAVFYVDDVEYVLSPQAQQLRLNQPRFPRSYETHDVQPDLNDGNQADDIHLVLRNAASTYDNSLALLAFLSDYAATGNADSLRRARLIGDALVYAGQHDRTYDDGRLRSWYSAGDLTVPAGWKANGRPETPAMPGFHEESTGQYHEFGQTSIDTGNNAWAMIGLLSLYKVTGDAKYRDAAIRVGEFLLQFRNDEGQFQGFQGGLEEPEGSSPTRRGYASTEHNLDLVRAYDMAFQATGDEKWYHHARHAETFVAAMKEAGTGCILTGTIDAQTPNNTLGQLPLDVQAWSVLVFPDADDAEHASVLACAETVHRTWDEGFDLYDFNDDRDGVWFEGAAHMALAYAVSGRFAQAGAINAQLQQAQRTQPYGNGRGLAAASHDGVSSGFGFAYYRVFHVGATAFHVMAQAGFNPYHQSFAAVEWRNPDNPLDVNGDGIVTPMDALLGINYLNTYGSGRLPAIPTPPFGAPPFLDVTGDRMIVPLDVLLVINFLNAPVGEGEGPAAATPPVGDTGQMVGATFSTNIAADRLQDRYPCSPDVPRLAKHLRRIERIPPYPSRVGQDLFAEPDDWWDDDVFGLSR